MFQEGLGVVCILSFEIKDFDILMDLKTMKDKVVIISMSRSDQGTGSSIGARSHQD